MPKIDNISTFLKALSKIVQQDTENEYFFRGHANKKWQLHPAIYRNFATPKYIINEDKIFREIISKAPNEFIHENSVIEKLVKMQHYGIPTRLLDITSNALVALYFACTDDKFIDSDGEIICFKIPKKRIKFYDSDQVSMLANLAKVNIEYTIEEDFLNYRKWLDSTSFEKILSESSLKYKKENYDKAQIEKENESNYLLFFNRQKTTNYPLNRTYFDSYDPYFNFNKDDENVNKVYYSDFIRDFNSSEFAGYLLHEIKNEKPQFKNLMNPFHFDNIIPVKVKQSNARIIKQSGAFLLYGMKQGDKSKPADINHYGIEEELKIKINRIGIKAGEIKRNIIKELKTIGITESTLFPEIEHQADVVKKMYS